MQGILLISFIMHGLGFMPSRYMKPNNFKTNKLQVYMNKLNVYEAKTDTQKQYVSMMESDNYNLIIANGAAGTGKTLLACQSALKELYNGDKDKIIITRPAVPVEEDLGFLPGTINKKMDPWTRPIMDIFNDFHSKNNVKNMMKDNTIEISPLGFMRGRTFKNAFIIADEMQNCSPNQMMMLLTRLGENSKIVITGDLNQCDKDCSGLKDLLERMHIYYYSNMSNMKEDRIGIVEFKNEDVLRSELVTTILNIYNQ